MSVTDMRPGDTATIVGVGSSGAVRRRLLDLGFLPAETIQLTRRLGRGGPYWIKLGTAQMALRREEAAALYVNTAA